MAIGLLGTAVSLVILGPSPILDIESWVLYDKIL